MPAISLADLLRAVADTGSLDLAAARVRLPVAEVRRLLAEAASQLEEKPAPQGPLFAAPRRVPSPTASSAAAPPLAAAPPATPPARTPAESPAPRTAAGAPSRVLVYTDGAARGNPGPAGAGAVIRAPDGRILQRLGKFLGVQTNNVAEYEGALLGLRGAHALGAREVELRSDSLLLVSQLRGEWKVKHAGLKPLVAAVQDLARRFERVSFVHVRRELNTDADEMSNRAIDERM